MSDSTRSKRSLGMFLAFLALVGLVGSPVSIQDKALGANPVFLNLIPVPGIDYGLLIVCEDGSVVFEDHWPDRKYKHCDGNIINVFN